MSHVQVYTNFKVWNLDHAALTVPSKVVLNVLHHPSPIDWLEAQLLEVSHDAK